MLKRNRINCVGSLLDGITCYEKKYKIKFHHSVACLTSKQKKTYVRVFPLKHTNAHIHTPTTECDDVCVCMRSNTCMYSSAILSFILSVCLWLCARIQVYYTHLSCINTVDNFTPQFRTKTCERKAKKKRTKKKWNSHTQRQRDSSVAMKIRYGTEAHTQPRKEHTITRNRARTTRFSEWVSEWTNE